MKYLFFLAHPDDEVVSSGGTIKLLADQGDEVIVVLATKGLANLPKGKASFTRINEFKRSCEILGISKTEVLSFKDGGINNKQVWGELELTFIEKIEKYKPEVIMTYDHSGWYFHLDHVGVSISALRAMQHAKHKVQALVLMLFHPPGTKLKWPYVYQKKLPVTHVVDVRSVIKQKVLAIKAHKSQKMGFLPLMKTGLMNREYFQLALATRKGKMWLNKSKIFKKI